MCVFFIAKNQRRISQERNTHRRYNMLLQAVQSRYYSDSINSCVRLNDAPEVNTGENKSILAACSPLYVIIDIFDRFSTAL